MYEARAVEAERRTAAELREMRERVRGACEAGERQVAQARERLEEERKQQKLSEVCNTSTPCEKVRLLYISLKGFT